MIRNILSIFIIAITFSSCAVLYTPGAEPTPFMREKDGTAINGNIGTNGSGVVVNANITKPLSDVVCVNASGAIGLLGLRSWPENPLVGGKSQRNLALNLGINTTKKTKYPLMIWIGGQIGSSSDSYGLPINYPGNSKDSAVVTTLDTNGNIASITRYEIMSGSFIAMRLGLTHVILSNYDNNFAKRDRKKTRLDLMGSPYLNLIRYNYKNAFTFKTRYNELLGYSIVANIGKPKWLFSIKADIMKPIIQMTNDIRKIETDVYHPGFSEVPSIVPSISFTKFIGRN